MQRKKNTTIWIVLLALPIPLLILNSVIQSIFRATDPESNHVLINIFSIIVGSAAVVMLLGIPIWVIRLIRANKYNTAIDEQIKKESQVAPESSQPQ